MSFEFYQIPVNGDGESVEALNRCLRAGRIASVRKEFVAHGENSFWAFCVERVESTGATRNSGSTGTKPRVDYKEVLSEEDLNNSRDVVKNLDRKKYGVPPKCLRSLRRPFRTQIFWV